MRCEKYRPWIALAIEGDLAGSQQAKLDAHLENCADCRAYSEAIGVSQDALKALGREPLPEAALAEVRVRVCERVGQTPPRSDGWGLRLTWSAVGAVVLAVGLFSLARHQTSDPDATSLTLPPISVANQTYATGVHARDTEMMPALRAPIHESTTPKPPALIKLLTNDPNVVIYWMTDNTEENGHVPTA